MSDTVQQMSLNDAFLVQSMTVLPMKGNNWALKQIFVPSDIMKCS